jgi:hypothetical protein
LEMAFARRYASVNELSSAPEGERSQGTGGQAGAYVLWNTTNRRDDWEEEPIERMVKEG